MRKKIKILIAKKGSALILLYFVMVILTTFFVVFTMRSISDYRASQRNADILEAYYLAESGLDQAKHDLNELFETYYISQGRTTNAFTWFDNLDTSAGITAKYPNIPTNAVLPNIANSTYSVQIVSIDKTVTVPKDVAFLCTAQVNNITKSINAVARFSMSPSRVFDYSYFVNNYGWFWGGGITSQGEVRANSNFSFNGNPEVNGDVYASINPALGAGGTISGTSRNDTINQYRSQADSSARPTNPAADPQDINGDGVLETFDYENGYAGTSRHFASQQLLDMPYLGDLTYYKGLASTYNGTISQGGITLVDHEYNGNVVLIGTDANPIVVSGPVVVSGDVLIKGVIQGQGTIYSGRNTHILGDLKYKNSSTWPKPDIDPTGTDTTNNAKDFLGLAAKGNVVIGDYTRNDWKTNVTPYLKPSFTKAYEVDPTDNTIGYTQYYSGGKPYFNGNYTANDGGKKADNTNRKFYESSYTDAYIGTVADSASSIRQIDAVVYTNHAIAGKVGAFTMNGSIVSRDEAIIYSGNITMNYDLRVKSKGDDFYLPRELAAPHTQYLQRN